jgi:hypothetical protein
MPGETAAKLRRNCPWPSETCARHDHGFIRHDLHSGTTLTAAVGVAAFAAAFGGWTRRAATALERIGAGIAGVLRVLLPASPAESSR